MKSRLLWIGVMVGLVGLFATGCAKKSIVGKWSGTIPIPGGHGSINTIIEYKPDGTESTLSQVGTQALISTGKYTVNDNIITETATSLSVNGNPTSLPPQLAKPQTATFKLDGDKLLLTPSDSKQMVTLTRIKS